MIYSLIHCYSDNNKGDAGIILATIHAIKKADTNAEINLFSTYSSKDEKFETDHQFLKQNCDNLYTSFFPEPGFKIGGKQYNGTIAKLVSFVFLYLKWKLVLAFAKSAGMRNILLNKDEKTAVKKLSDSNFVISKGGSFLYSEGNIRSTLSLIRMLYPFDLSKRLGKKVIILGQSLGPIVSPYDQKIFNRTLAKIDEIYIREVECINYLKKLKTPIDFEKLKVIPDLAFCLPYDHVQSPVEFPAGQQHVGFTIVDHHDFKVEGQKEIYADTMRQALEHVAGKISGKVYIFPQVIVPGPYGTSDLRLTKEIHKKIKTELKDRIVVLEDNYNAFELKKMYSFMDYFVATRLHSAIFAQAALVPTINIGYHGTKSIGTMKLLGLEKYMLPIDDITPEILIQKIDELDRDKEETKKHLKIRINEVQTEIFDTVDQLIYPNKK